MKKIFFAVLILLILSAGCSDTKKEAVETAETILSLPDKASVTADLVEIRNSVNFFYAQKGYFPEDLGVLNLNLNNPESDFIYDQSKGSVKHKDYPQI
jgi:hypothetical protein